MNFVGCFFFQSSINNYEIQLMIREFYIYFVKLQKKLSISVPLQVVNLVGRVISEKRLN